MVSKKPRDFPNNPDLAKLNTLQATNHRFVGQPYRLNDASNFSASRREVHWNEMRTHTYREMFKLIQEDLTVSHSLELMEHDSEIPDHASEIWLPVER